MKSKKELITAIAEKTGMTQEEAERAFNATFDVIAEELAAGNKVNIFNFGTFKPKQRREREGRNPQNGEAITIEAAVKASFSQSIKLKKALNP